MNRKVFLIIGLGIVIIALLVSKARDNRLNPNSAPPAVTKTVNKYIYLYAGSYYVRIDGMGAGEAEEVFVLHKDGTAKWIWIVPDRSAGAKVDSEKSGSWTASGGRIVISVQGNTGVITEEFNQNGGRFQSTTSRDRYLKLQKSYD